MPDSPTRRLPERLRPAFELVGVALLAVFLASFVPRHVAYQGDLKTYLLAGRAVLGGLDPYAPGTLSALAGRRVFPFVYPPLALLPWIAAAQFPAKAVAAVWIWGKIALLGALVFAWSRWLRGVPVLALALVAVFGWNSSAQWDLTTGNVAIVECALIWGALGCYAAGRRPAFVLLIALAACIKVLPAAFLLLLLAPTERRAANLKWLAASATLVAALVLGPVVVGPFAHHQHFWSHVPDATEFGAANPSALGLATLAAHAAGLSGEIGAQVATIFWIAYALALVALSAPFVRRLVRERDALTLAMSAVFLYVLLQPRPMAYGFAILTPVPFFFVPASSRKPARPWLLAGMLSAQGLLRLTSISPNSAIVTYAPLLLSLCVWLLVLDRDAQSRSAARPSAEPVAAPASEPAIEPATPARAA
jgi:hypothetical protein